MHSDTSFRNHSRLVLLYSYCSSTLCGSATSSLVLCIRSRRLHSQRQLMSAIGQGLFATLLGRGFDNWPCSITLFQLQLLAPDVFLVDM